MKVQLNFSTIVNINTDDFDEAERLAEAEASWIARQILFRAGKSLNYEGCSFGPELDNQIDILKKESDAIIEMMTNLAKPKNQ